ncbi:MAG: hypothetical protein JSV42_07365 [Chloroflexota bacterium]|nr:MAG: hypothetical protein JSV42_07365 [Chloroflexota bacterium]
MPKTFYTDRDIEDLAKRGVISLVLDDDVVLTDLARDKAMRLGIELVRKEERPPSAPERPYITKMVSPSASEDKTGTGKSSLGPERPYITKLTSPSAQDPTGESDAGRTTTEGELYESVRAEVISRLGDAVDPQLLDTIIRRVLQNVGGK